MLRLVRPCKFWMLIKLKISKKEKTRNSSKGSCFIFHVVRGKNKIKREINVKCILFVSVVSLFVLTHHPGCTILDVTGS